MKFIKYSIVTLAFNLCITACSHKNNESQLGPSYCFETVQSLSNNRSGEADFTKEADSIKAVLNGNGDWKIKITGLTSKAVKYYKGNSLVINQLWYGENDSTLFFQAGEDCKIELFTNCQATQTVMVKIKSNADFSKTGYFIDDFESALKFTTNPNKFLTGSLPQIGSVQPYQLDSSVNPIQGKFFYRIAGYAPGTGYYINDIKATIDSNKVQALFGKDINADDLAVSFYLNFNGVKTTKLKVMLDEAACPDQYCRTIELSNPSSDRGWVLKTIKLSDFGVKYPKNLRGIKFQPGCMHAFDKIDVSVDLIRLVKVEK